MKAKAAYKHSLINCTVKASGAELSWTRTTGSRPSSFAHPDSVAYLQCNPDVLLLDCTYKTNKYDMPLLDMVGVDSCQRSFCIAFAFLSGESEDDYTWALQHLRSLYQRDLPSAILTDRCIAAMNAAAIWFSSAKALLCLWACE